MAKPRPKPFGEALREKRLEKKMSLRKFALAVGVSPTYLSQVEQGNVDPPTADRVKRMAEVLEVNVDDWIGWAGRVADDLPDIIKDEPIEMPDLLRAMKGMNADQLRKLREEAERLKRGGE